MIPTLEDEAFDELEKRLQTHQKKTTINENNHIMSGQSANQQKLRDHFNAIMLGQHTDHEPSTTQSYPSTLDKQTSTTHHGSRADDRQVGGTHYKNMTVSPWDVVDTWPIEQRIGAYRAGALKYIMRMGKKNEESQEIAKSIHYLEKLLDTLNEARGTD